MESAASSARNVAAKILGKSGSVTRTRNIKEHMCTPSEDVTPRTLIGGILDAASVSKSGLVAPQTRKSKLTKSPATGHPTKRNKALRQSLGDNVTPRTIIQNFLLEASPETPLQAPQEHPENHFQDDSIGASTPSIPHDMEAPASSSLSDSETTDNLNLNFANPKEHSAHTKDSLLNADVNVQYSLAMDTEKEKDTLLGEDAENDDYKAVKVPSPAPLNTEVAEQSPEQATDSSTTMASDEQGSQSDSIPDAETAMLSMDHTSEPPGKRTWKDLVTPQVPVKRRYVLSENQMVEEDEEEERETRKRTTKAAKKKPAYNKRNKTKSTSSGDTNLPSSLVKSLFQHFSKSRISRNTLSSIEKGSSVFFKQISSDLMAFSKHAGRSTIEIGDVELLMKRQGFITDKQSLNSLIEKYLPLEYRQELIPVVQSGNNVVLKKSN